MSGATDPDGDTLTYSASGLPAGASFDPATPAVLVDPGFTQAGTYPVTFTASDGTKSYSLSGSKDVTITVRDVPAPAAETAPSISGPAEVNAVLTAEPGTWDVDGTTFGYQWSADGQAIAGATSAKLVVTPDLSGKAVAVTVTASAAGRPDGSATSQPVTIKTIAAWNSTAVYNAGDLVIHNGKLYKASWWTQNQAPGDPSGSWQELAVTADGTTAWTASRTFNAGDQAYYRGQAVSGPSGGPATRLLVTRTGRGPRSCPRPPARPIGPRPRFTTRVTRSPIKATSTRRNGGHEMWPPGSRVAPGS